VVLKKGYCLSYHSFLDGGKREVETGGLCLGGFLDERIREQESFRNSLSTGSHGNCFGRL